MTIAHAIARFDTLYPNTYAYAEKLRWLSELDGMIAQDVFGAYEHTGHGVFTGYTIYTDKQTALLVPFPYDDIYVKYLAAQCDCANSDSVRYQNSSVIFNTAYNEFVNHFNRTHRAKETKIRL